MANFSSNFLSKRFFGGPSEIKTFPDCFNRNSRYSRPFGHIERSTIKGNHSGKASVFHLFGFCSPFTIFGFIISIIVNSFELMFGGWSIAKISIERFKRISPFRTNLYSSFTIVFITFIVFIFTSFYHVSPGSIDGSLGHSVSDACFRNDSFSVATTTDNLTANKMASSDFFNCSAFAFARPIDHFVFSEFSSKFNDGKFSEFSTNKIMHNHNNTQVEWGVNKSWLSFRADPS